MTFHVYPDKKGEWRWRLRSANGRIVADSGQSFASRKGALEAAKNVRYWLQKKYVGYQVEDLRGHRGEGS